jgi:hypothetical protein
MAVSTRLRCSAQEGFSWNYFVDRSKYDSFQRSCNNSSSTNRWICIWIYNINSGSSGNWSFYVYKKLAEVKFILVVTLWCVIKKMNYCMLLALDFVTPYMHAPLYCCCTCSHGICCVYYRLTKVMKNCAAFMCQQIIYTLVTYSWWTPRRS